MKTSFQQCTQVRILKFTIQKRILRKRNWPLLVLLITHSFIKDEYIYEVSPN